MLRPPARGIGGKDKHFGKLSFKGRAPKSLALFLCAFPSSPRRFCARSETLRHFSAWLPQSLRACQSEKSVLCSTIEHPPPVLRPIGCTVQGMPAETHWRANPLLFAAGIYGAQSPARRAGGGQILSCSTLKGVSIPSQRTGTTNFPKFLSTFRK